LTGALTLSSGTRPTSSGPAQGNYFRPITYSGHCHSWPCLASKPPFPRIHKSDACASLPAQSAILLCPCSRTRLRIRNSRADKARLYCATRLVARIRQVFVARLGWVNKRVSRLAANIPLIRMNLCPLSFVDVPDRHYTGGMLGVYELNDVAYLRDVFVWAYLRSCNRYSAVRQTLGEPDPFLLRHRMAIKDLVSNVVTRGMSKTEAIAWIREQVADVTPMDNRKRLIEVVETELMCLHQGSIARYKLRPSEFDAWKATWS